MPIIGIIAEYNPFHNGHRYQLDKIREQYPQAKFIIVMSGSFTRRGDTALSDKWNRAALAVRNGCDLILELPLVFALRSAQDFARGGISLLAKLRCVDYLAFGLEQDNLSALQAAAAAIDTTVFQDSLHQRMLQGSSYAAAMGQLLSETVGIPLDVLKQPNTILALEYLRALKNTSSSIQPLPVRRHGAAYHDTAIHGSFASASAIRTSLHTPTPDWNALASVLPPDTLSLLKELHPARLPKLETLYPALLSRLCCFSREELAQIHGIGEGLEGALLAAARAADTLDAFLKQLTCKRYPTSRIRRLILCLLLGLTKERIASFDSTGPRYARILAFNETGRQLLHTLRQTTSLPLITKTAQHITSTACSEPFTALNPLQQMLLYDCRGTDLQALCLQPPNPRARDFTTSPRYLP